MSAVLSPILSDFWLEAYHYPSVSVQFLEDPDERWQVCCCTLMGEGQRVKFIL